MRGLWLLEPAVVLGLVTAGLTLIVSFGFDVSTEQQEAIKSFVTAVIVMAGAVATRQAVAPNAKVRAKFGEVGLNEVESVTRSEAIEAEAAPKDSET